MTAWVALRSRSHQLAKANVRPALCGMRSTRAASGITTASRAFLQRTAIQRLLVALSDGLLESAYLDDAEGVPALVGEAVARRWTADERRSPPK